MKKLMENWRRYTALINEQEGATTTTKTGFSTFTPAGRKKSAEMMGRMFGDDAAAAWKATGQEAQEVEDAGGTITTTSPGPAASKPLKPPAPVPTPGPAASKPTSTTPPTGPVQSAPPRPAPSMGDFKMPASAAGSHSDIMSKMRSRRLREAELLEDTREDVDQFADMVDIIQGAGEPFIDVGKEPTKAFKTPPLQVDPVGMRTARRYKAETPGEKVDRTLKHKISQAISPQSRSRRRRVRAAADKLGKLGTAGAFGDLALAATDSDATGAQRGARGAGAAGELAYLKSLTPKGQRAVRTAAGRHAAGALSKAAPAAFAAQAGYELGKQVSPYIAKGAPGLFGPGAAEQAGKGVTDIDWRPSEIGKTLKYMLQPGEQQRESLNLQLSTDHLKEIILEEIEALLREAQKASKSVGDPPYRERGSTESQAQQMAAGAALSARRGDTPVSKLKGASLDLYNGEISTKDLRNLAKLGQKVKGHKSKEPKHRKSLPGHATPAKD